MRDLFLSVEFWQNLRYAAIYPILAVTGLAWAIGFFVRHRFSGSPGDRWAGRMGLAIALFAVSGMVGLFLAQEGGFTIVTTIIFSAGTLFLCGVMIWGTASLLHYYLIANRRDR